MVEKLGFREEAYHARYMHIDGAWRDHIGYAMTSEDVAAEGGLLARWHRVRAAAGESSHASAIGAARRHPGRRAVTSSNCKLRQALPVRTIHAPERRSVEDPAAGRRLLRTR